MRMGIPAMNATRTRQLEALLFPRGRSANRHVASREVRVLGPMAASLFGPHPFCRGAGLVARRGLGRGLGRGALDVEWLAPRKVYRGQWATTDGRHLSAHQGWWFRKRVMIDWHKLQAVELTQNRIHARRNVAHLTFHTSSGVAHLRFLPTDVARELRDLAMAQVHAHRGPWM